MLMITDLKYIWKLCNGSLNLFAFGGELNTVALEIVDAVSHITRTRN